MSLEDFFKKENKKSIYDFYKRIVTSPKDYDKISREQIYKIIMAEYNKDPEIILKMSSIEELNILKSLLDAPVKKKDYGFIEHLLFSNLKSNYLVLEAENEYFIPDDLVNYVKMALNLWDEKENSFRDITDSIIIGLIRIHNVLEIEEFISLLKKYNCVFTNLDNFKKYVLKSPKLTKKLDIIKYKKKNYVISLEYEFYEDVLKNKKDIEYQKYALEDIISIGKYKIDLFREPVFKFLNFLELHLEPIYIEYIIDDIIGYMGLYINNLDIVKRIADNIDDLYKNILNILPYLPIWIFNGNDLLNLKNKQE